MKLVKKLIINGFWETKEEAISTTDQIERLIAKKVATFRNCYII